MAVIGYWDEKRMRDRVVEALKDDLAVLGTSDTVLGLFAQLTESGFKRLNSIKTRFEKPYLVLIQGVDSLALFAPPLADTRLKRVLARCWPGPLTVILPALPALPSCLCSVERTIALRVPRHEGLISILSSFDGLFSTSANRSGQPVAVRLDEVDATIKAGVAAIIADRKETVQSLPSTILDCSGQKPRIVRYGAYSIDELEALYGEKFLGPADSDCR